MGTATRQPVPPIDLDIATVVERLSTDAARGLAAAEAARRLAHHGPNELPRQRPPGAWAILARQFKDVMVLVLVAAIVLSLALGHRVEAAAIAVITAFTVTLGFVQEQRATLAIEGLRRLAAPRANVVRDGTPQSVDAATLVPGDILLLGQGDVVPADARLLEAVDLQVAEAPLTGESMPVAKDARLPMAADLALGDRSGMVHAATAVAYGRARAVVVATGEDTQVGRIGHLLSTVTSPPTPLQKQLAGLARWLLLAGGLAVLAIVVLGALRGEPLGEMVLFGIAVAVAIVPEALPAVVTISLALGAQRMARRKAIVSRLPTVETLGATTVICSDKTGTLTTGQMSVTQVVVHGQSIRLPPTGAPDGQNAPAQIPSSAQGAKGVPGSVPGTSSADELYRKLALAAVLCNDATLTRQGDTWVVSGDPMEGALLIMAEGLGVPISQSGAHGPRLHEVAFSSERKLMTTVHAIAGQATASSKGAPEAILANCATESSKDGPLPLDAARRQAWLAEADALASGGMRVLAFARRVGATATNAEQDQEFLGLAGLFDAPRPQARAAIATCNQAGIRPIMVTGDHPKTAKAVARDLGILDGGQVMTGPELERIDDDELRSRSSTVDVYARVSPAHKLRIVTALQAQGAVVAMTGDGVNDAPALRKADIGIAMGISGTDVAKEAAAMTLGDDNFATIVAAVEEGRAIFDNVRKYLMFLLSTNFGEVLLVAGSMVAGLPLPLTAVQILYVNLASDGLPALALAVDPHDDDLMRRPPRRPGASILEGPVVLLMMLGGVVSALANLAVFVWALQAGRPLDEAMSLTFVSLVVIQLAKAYVFRLPRRGLLRRPFQNRWLNLAVGWEILLLGLLIYVPFLQGVFGTHALGLSDWGAVLLATLLVVGLLEAGKYWMRRRESRMAPQPAP